MRAAISLIHKIIRYAGVVALLTGATLLWLNPQQLSYWQHSLPRLPEHYPTWLLQRAPEDSPSLPPKMYRYDLQRTGFTEEAMKTNLIARRLAREINFGIHGASKSSPTDLGAGRLVIPADNGVLRALDANGKEAWRYRTDVSDQGFHGTAARWGRQILIGDYAGFLYSFTFDGRISWILPLGDVLGSSAGVTDDGRLFISVETEWPDGYLAAVDLKKGQLLWTSPLLGEQSHSSPALDIHGEVLVAGDNANHVNGISPRDGSFLWRIKVGGPVKSTPTLVGDTAFATSWDRHLYAFDIKTGQVRWRSQIESELNNQSSVAALASRGWGFVNTARGTCRFDLRDGLGLLCDRSHRALTRPGRSRIASPVVSRSKIAAESHLVWSACDDASFCVFDASTMRRLNTWSLGSPLSGEPLIADGRVTLVTDGDDGVFQLVDAHQ